MPMKLVVTIHEPTPDRTVEAIRAIDARHDMVEVRVDAFGVPAEADTYTALRAATTKPMWVSFVTVVGSVNVWSWDAFR